MASSQSLIVLTFLSVLAVPFVYGEGVSLWVSGVSSASGWIDVNKAHVPYSGEDAWEVGNGNTNSRTDVSLCWAAQASNMLQYWQNAYTAAGNALPDRAPDGLVAGREDKTRRQYQIFEYFISNWSDAGGDGEYGIPWYLVGEIAGNYPTGDYRWSQCFGGMEAGGLFKHVYSSYSDLVGGDFKTYDFAHRNTASEFADISGFSSLLLGCLQDGLAVVGLNIYIPQTSGGTLKHAVTLWGCDYDAAGLITKVYLTDSDDGEVALKSFSLVGNSDGVYLSDYSENGLTKIQDFSMLSVASIPEPSAFGLLAGIFMLGFVSSRRRK